MRQKPTQTIAEIRRAQARVPGYDPRLHTTVAARFAGMTPSQLRYRHRALATKSAHGRLRWRWSDVEAILAGKA